MALSDGYGQFEELVTLRYHLLGPIPVWNWTHIIKVFIMKC